MVNRSRTAFLSGTITDNPLTDSATTLNSAALANLPAIASPDIAVLVLDPAGSGGAPEVVYVTAHTGAATSATITRGEENTVAREHSATVPWVHGPTILDIEEHLIKNAHRNAMDLTTEGFYGIFSPAGFLLGASFSGQTLGLGWGCLSNASGRYDSVASNGSAQFSTGATSTNYIVLVGTYLDIANDPVLAAKVNFVNVGANAEYFIGFTGSQDPTDGNNRYGFRVIGTGNLIAFSDNGGVETTRDFGSAPVAGTFYKLEIVVLEGGTIIKFFVDGVQLGADVTTNLYTTSALQPFIGVETGTSAAKAIAVSRAVYYDNP